MVEYFDSIKFEVETSDGWIDLTPDVQVSPYPKWNRGIMSNKPDKAVGDPGYLSFDLDNSSDNSASTQSYYSPGSSDCWADWRPGLPVRLYFSFESDIPYYKFYGHIMPNGIKADPGAKGNRKVHVTVGDFMAFASRHEIRGLTVQASKRADEVIPLVLANIPTEYQPLATSLDTGVYTFPTVFDCVRSGVTTAVSEFEKLAKSELGFIFEIGDRTGGQTLKFQNKTRRGSATAFSISKSDSQSSFLLMETSDFLLLETGYKILLDEIQSASFTQGYLSEGTQISYGDNLYNRVRTTVYPRQVDAAATTVLFSLQDDFTLASLETKNNFECRYKDPSGGLTRINGTDMRVPTTDDFYAETSDGVDATTDITLTATFYSDAAVYNLVNNVASSRIVKTLKAVGKGIYLYDPITNVYNTSDSQERYGLSSLDWDMKYQNDPTVGDGLAAQIIAAYSSPEESMERAEIFANRDGMSIYGFLQVEPGIEIAAILESVTGYTRPNPVVNGYEAEIRDGKFVWWRPVIYDAPGFL